MICNICVRKKSLLKVKTNMITLRVMVQDAVATRLRKHSAPDIQVRRVYLQWMDAAIPATIAESLTLTAT